MKKLIFSLFALCLTASIYGQVSQTLSGNQPISLTSTGTGTYNQSVLYHSYTYGHMLELARTSNLLTANPIDFRISARGGGYNPFFIQGSSGNIGIGTTSPTSSLHINSSNSRGMKFSRSGANDFGYEIGGTTFGLYDYTDAKYMWRTGNGNVLLVESSGNVGIGTNSPNAKLEIHSSGNSEGVAIIDNFSGTSRLHIWNKGDYSNSGAELLLMNGSNNFADRGASINYKSNGNILNINNTGDPSSIIAFTNRTSTDSNERMRIHSNGNIGIGTTSPTEKLSVDGTVLAKKVRVSTAGADWPDYVFEESYKLQTLSEVEDYIKANKHLPEVPSAKKVEKAGPDLGKMDATLLKKVEELTLYLIEMDKKVKDQGKRIKELEVENGKLKRGKK